jgi:hypothetical protein
MADPITRDLRAYVGGSLAILILFIVVLATGGMVLKHERKLVPIKHQGCYLWSDGATQCDRT